MNHKTTFELTGQQLADLIDKAFNLGKVYATDELNTTAIKATTVSLPTSIPVWKSEAEWTEFIESNGGHTLYSGLAKEELLYNAVKHIIRERFAEIICFD